MLAASDLEILHGLLEVLNSKTKKMRNGKTSSLASLGGILEMSMHLRLWGVLVSIVVLWGWQKDNDDNC